MLQLPNAILVRHNDAAAGLQRADEFTSFRAASRGQCFALLARQWALACPDLARACLGPLPLLPGGPLPPIAASGGGGDGCGSGSGGNGGGLDAPALLLSPRGRSGSGPGGAPPLAWEPLLPAAALPAPPAGMRLVADVAFDCAGGARGFADVCLADGSGFFPAVLRAQGNTPLTVTPWQPPPPGAAPTPVGALPRGGAAARRVTYLYPGGRGVGFRSAVILEQAYAPFDGGALALEWAQTMPDLPAGLGRAFHLECLWLVTPLDGGGGSGGGGGSSAAEQPEDGRKQAGAAAAIARPPSTASVASAGPVRAASPAPSGAALAENTAVVAAAAAGAAAGTEGDATAASAGDSRPPSRASAREDSVVANRSASPALAPPAAAASQPSSSRMAQWSRSFIASALKRQQQAQAQAAGGDAGSVDGGGGAPSDGRASPPVSAVSAPAVADAPGEAAPLAGPKPSRSPDLGAAKAARRRPWRVGGESAPAKFAAGEGCPADGGGGGGGGDGSVAATSASSGSLARCAVEGPVSGSQELPFAPQRQQQRHQGQPISASLESDDTSAPAHLPPSSAFAAAAGAQAASSDADGNGGGGGNETAGGGGQGGGSGGGVGDGGGVRAQRVRVRVFLGVRFDRFHVARAGIESQAHATTAPALAEMADAAAAWCRDAGARQTLAQALPSAAALPAAPRHRRTGSHGSGGLLHIAGGHHHRRTLSKGSLPPVGLLLPTEPPAAAGGGSTSGSTLLLAPLRRALGAVASAAAGWAPSPLALAAAVAVAALVLATLTQALALWRLSRRLDAMAAAAEAAAARQAELLGALLAALARREDGGASAPPAL